LIVVGWERFSAELAEVACWNAIPPPTQSQGPLPALAGARKCSARGNSLRMGIYSRVNANFCEHLANNSRTEYGLSGIMQN